MADTTGTSWLQVKSAERHGTQNYGQASDGTGTSGNLPKFNADGSLTDSGVPVSGSGAFATIQGVQQESYTYAADTGTANAYAIALSPAPTIVAGSVAVLKVTHTNTGASTLAVNGGTATAIKKESSGSLVDLASGDWSAGQIAVIISDGTVWQWVSGSGAGSSVLLQTNGVSNTSQSKLNLVAGTGVTLSADGSGDTTVASSSGPSGSYNVNFSLLGQPSGGSSILTLFVFTESVTFASNWSGSQGKVQTNPTGSQSWTLNKNGSSVGTVSISTGGAVTFTSSGSISFASGDLLTLVGASSADATLANVDIVLQGLRSTVTSTPIAVIPFQWLGQPAGSQLLGQYVFTNAITFLGNFSGAQGNATTNPAATWTATINKNGSSCGSVSISTSGVFTFSSTSGAAVSFVAGDEITAVGPSTPDTSLQNVAFSFSGSAGGFVQLGGDLGGSSTSPIVIGINGKSVAVADDTGSANAYVVTTPYPFILAKYAEVTFVAGHTNTGASTLNVNSGGAVAVKKGGSTALAGGEISGSQIVSCFYDGTNWQMVSWSGASGAGGGSISTGTRASLPSSVPAAGSVYVCTDSPFTEYVSDGTNWNGRCCGIAVKDPALDSSFVNLQTATFTPTISSSQGGYLITGTVSGDQCFCYGKPVTPSSTLKVSLGLTQGGYATLQSGIAIFNNNTTKAVFLRIVGGTLYYSRYSTSGLSGNTSTAAFANPWPHWGNWVFRFDGTNWYFETYFDINCTQKMQSVFSEALSSWIGTNYTHIGYAINGGSIVWGQHFRIISL